MDNKKIGGIAIICVIIVVIVLLILLLNSISTDDNNENVIINDPIQFQNEGGASYSDTQLESLDIEIVGSNQELEEIIYDMEEFDLEIKKYIYLNGLVDAKTVTITNWILNDNILTINLNLDDANKTSIELNINVDDGSYNFK